MLSSVLMRYSMWVNGRMVVQTGELLVQDLHLGHGHLQGAAVQVIYPYHALSQLPLLRRSAGGNGDTLRRMLPLFSIIMGQKPPYDTFR